jgi:hypothetical protein
MRNGHLDQLILAWWRFGFRTSDLKHAKFPT